MTDDDCNKTLTLEELDLLRKLDGHPPLDTVAISREVQPMAIRAVRELRQMRSLLARFLALPYSSGTVPHFSDGDDQAEYGRVRLDALRVLQGTLVEPTR
jgi:hypothetical protein